MIPHHKDALRTVASSRDGSGICPSLKIAGSRTSLPDPVEAPASVTMRVVPTFFLYSTAHRYARLPFVNLSGTASQSAQKGAPAMSRSALDLTAPQRNLRP